MIYLLQRRFQTSQFDSSIRVKSQPSVSQQVSRLSHEHQETEVQGFVPLKSGKILLSHWSQWSQWTQWSQWSQWRSQLPP